MEQAVYPEVAEVDRDPDLLEAYAEQELTMFGMTGKLSDLAEMCPLPMDDPRMTVELKNEFVIKAANVSGMAIAPEHQSVFDTYLTKHSLERNYTVAQPEFKSRQSEVEVAEVVPEAVVNEQHQPTPKPVLSPRAPEQHTPIVAEPAPIAVWQRLEEAIVHESLVETVSFSPDIEQPAIVLYVKPKQQEAVIVQSITTIEQQSEEVLALPEPISLTIEQFYDDLLTPHVLEQKLVPTEFVAPTEQTFDQIDDGETSETIKTEAPIDILHAIELFAAISRAPEASLVESDAALKESAPPIITQVVERFSQLTEEAEAEVQPLLEAISISLHIAELLADDPDVTPEILAAKQLELETMVQTLFIELGLTYTSQDVTEFIAFLASPELRELQRLDTLEKMGTREHKFFRQAMPPALSLRRPNNSLIGMLALLYTGQRSYLLTS